MAITRSPAARQRRQAAPELVITRVFDAPRPLVFKAWTEREHLVHWSCPQGFTLTQCEGDLRPGGAWRSCIRSPDGSDLWLGGVYREVVENERLVFTHAWDAADAKPGHETLVTVTFGDDDGKTMLTFRQRFFDSVESRDGHRGGWTECFEKLAALLARVRPTRPAGPTRLADRTA